MLVAILPNEQLALAALQMPFDVVIVHCDEPSCGMTTVLVPLGPYSDMFEDHWDEYKYEAHPIPHNRYETCQPLEAVKTDIEGVVYTEVSYEHPLAGV